jgi:hypothetical protein
VRVENTYSLSHFAAVSGWGRAPFRGLRPGANALHNFLNGGDDRVVAVKLNIMTRIIQYSVRAA